MCSKKWLIPVIPGRSFTLPTRATQPALTTFGWSVLGTSRNCIPFDKVNSSTDTFWAETISDKPKIIERKTDQENTCERIL
jgi:hypothetical protein